MVRLLIVLLGSFRFALRSRVSLVAEVLLLRQQLADLRRHVSRPALRHHDLLVLAFLSQVWKGWRSAMIVVKPDTVVRWHRALFRRCWTWKSRRRRPGRSPISAEIRDLIRDMSSRNPRWGVARIQGELRKIGLWAARSTIRRYMFRHPRPGPPQTWRTFIRNHMDCTWAADFFAVHTVTFRLLFVLVFLAYDRRRIVRVAVTEHPTSAWTARQLAEATLRAERPRFLIRDSDILFRDAFDRAAEDAGAEVVRIPVGAPNCAPYVERLVRTFREELFDHVVVGNARHLQRLLDEYVRFYLRRRHINRSTSSRPSPNRDPAHEWTRVALPILGGLHHDYRRVERSPCRAQVTLTPSPSLSASLPSGISLSNATRTYSTISIRSPDATSTSDSPPDGQETVTVPTSAPESDTCNQSELWPGKPCIP